jgi:hypothetical protein
VKGSLEKHIAEVLESKLPVWKKAQAHLLSANDILKLLHKVLQICSRMLGKPNCHLACCLVGDLHVHTSPPGHPVPRGNKLVIKEFNKCTPEAEGPVCSGCWPVKIWPRNCHMKIPQLPVNTGSTRDHIICGWSYQSPSKQPLCYHISNMVSTKVQKHKHISVSHPINNCV